MAEKTITFKVTFDESGVDPRSPESQFAEIMDYAFDHYDVIDFEKVETDEK